MPEKKIKKNNHLSTIISIVICFLIAFVLWIYVMMSENPEYEETFSDIPVTVENASKMTSSTGYSIFGNSEYLTDVTIKGQKSIIDNIDENEIKASVDVGDLTVAGSNIVHVDVSLPNNVQLVESSVEEITIYLDEKDTITVEIQAELASGTIPNNYECDYKPAVNYVEVTGPKSTLESLDHALVALDLGKIGRAHV